MGSGFYERDENAIPVRNSRYESREPAAIQSVSRTSRDHLLRLGDPLSDGLVCAYHTWECGLAEQVGGRLLLTQVRSFYASGLRIAFYSVNAYLSGHPF